jgi:hypothetical protein
MNPENRFWKSPAPGQEGIVSIINPQVPALTGNLEEDSFSFDALMIHAWLSQLLDEGIETYVTRRTTKFFGMQTGQAQRGFLRVFGHLADADFHRLVQSMYRFTTCDDPLAVILFRALDALSSEHESHGDYVALRAPDGAERPREAARWMRESLDRWFEWVDAYVHVQTHSQWHLAPECFDADPRKREAAIQALKRRRIEQFFSSRQRDWQISVAETTRFYRELPLWQVLPQTQISEPQRPWPHPELDEAIMSLWPLVKRHHWTFGDLLTVLKDLVDEPDAYPSQGERNLATYCLHTLRLRKTVQGRTSRRERPSGYVVALKLVPPMPPRPIFHFGPEAVEEQEPGIQE